MLDYIWPKFAAMHPDAAAICQPRRISPPYGYLNPKAYSTELLCFLKDNDRVVTAHDESLAWCCILSKLLVDYGVPTYFIDRDFIQAVYESDPPDCRLNDIEWPLPAMLFVLPMDFMQELTGGFHFPFIAVANAPVGRYQIAHPTLTTLDCPTVVVNDRNRFIFHYPGFFSSPEDPSDSVPVDYVTTYEITRHISELAKFDDFTDWTEGRPSSQLPVNQPTKEQEIAINQKLNSLTAKLLLAITACPSYIDSGARMWPKSEPKPHQKLDKPMLFAPSFIGLGRTANVRNCSSNGNGSGKTMPAHWRRGHFQWTVLGSKKTVYSVSNMPRTALGQIDWNSCTEEQIKSFKETHRMDWIPKMHINEEPGQLK